MPRKPTEKQEMRPINELHNWDNNPREIKAEDFERLKRQITKLCAVCETPFEPYRSTSLYCSSKCNNAARRARPQRREYMRQYLKDYYNTPSGKERVLAAHRAWESSESGRLHRKRNKAARRTIGTLNIAYWDWLTKRLSGLCVGCQQHFEKHQLQPDHIVPIKHGGTNDDWNIQPLCKSCNCRKGGRLNLLDIFDMDLVYGEYLLCQR